MKLSAPLILIATIAAYAYVADYYCKNFKEPTVPCLHKETKDKPLYSDGTPMKVGGYVCKQDVDDTQVQAATREMQGILVSLMRRTMVCRKIDSINPIGEVNSNCCVEYAKQEQISKLRYNVQNSRAIYYQAYDHCLTGRVQSCIYLDHYRVVYSSTYETEPDFDQPPTLAIKENSNAFLMRDTIEIFRDDGTLRYRGWVKLSNDALMTKGHCYNKTGTRQTRVTNNAALCQ